MTRSIIPQRLSQLREVMRKTGVDYYYVPSSDAHQSEYVPNCWQRRQWISGFTGSAGDALIGLNKAYLWTDPRYFLQAEQELAGSGYQLMKQDMQGTTPSIDEWLGQHAAGKVCSVDPKVITVNQAQKLKRALTDNGGKLVSFANNFVDDIWQDQPPLPTDQVVIQPEKYAGQSARDKIDEVRKRLKSHDCDAHVVSSLDAIAWLLNIRGHDVAFNPVVVSYVIVDKSRVTLFIDDTKLSDEVKAYLQSQGITVVDYQDLSTALAGLTGRVLVDPNVNSWWIARQLSQAEVVEGTSPLHMLKACKNKAESQGTRIAHRRDGVALVKFMYWLEQQAKTKLTEVDIVEKLRGFRKENKQFLGDSFATICGFAGNGAIVHYRAMPETAATVDGSAMLLVDSGAQYIDGTTDVTRTFHLGKPTAEQRQFYTLVLKGHLALRHSQFPHGTRGEHLDAIARQYLWQQGVDYGHGTGHGVGVHLCVHEGPQRISPGASGAALLPGMLVSNEPGIYLTDEYGIRIENVCQVVEALPVSKSKTGHGPFYTFEDMTMAPYYRKLIDITLLSPQEIKWIDAYHQQVLHALHDDLPKDVQKWLTQATKPLSL